jgi:hypothetical protein
VEQQQRRRLQVGSSSWCCVPWRPRQQRRQQHSVRLWAQQPPGQQLSCLEHHHALVLVCHLWVAGSAQCLADSGGSAAVLVLAGCGHKATA